jgi:uncharacterized protein (DUF697 family)
MMANTSTSWLTRLLQASLRAGLRSAYHQVQLNPQKYLRYAQRVHRLPIRTWTDARMLDESTLNPAAERVIKSSSRAAALEGMGLGIGGFTTLLPDMGILSAITVRMLQKLSLIYGFEYSTDDEVAALWMAAASAAGLDFARDFMKKQAAERVLPRIADAIALKMGAEVAEKWLGRAVPILSAGFAATLNYHFVRAWGRRAQRHFLEKRGALGVRSLAPRVLLLPSPGHVH